MASCVLLLVAVVVVNFFLKPVHDLFFTVDCLLFGIIIFLFVPKIKEAHKKAFFLNCIAALFVGFYLNTIFYKEIIPYKGQIAAAEYINQKPFDSFTFIR